MRRLVYALAAVCLAAQLALLLVEPSISGGLGLLLTGSFAGVGVLISSRRPENPIGWLFIGFSCTGAINFAADAYAWHTLIADPGSLPAGNVAASLGAHLIHPGFGFLVFSLLLFPNGHLLSPRWRWVARLTVVTYGGLALSGIFE